MKRSVALVCLACLLLFASSGYADSAAELDKKARAAFDSGDFTKAARAFEQAYRVKPHPATKYNAGFAWDRAGELARAADAYEAALNAEGLDDGRANAARERLAALKPQLGYLFVQKPIGATVSVAHVDKLPIPAKLHLTPGKHELVVHQAGGGTTTQAIELRAGEVQRIAVEEEDALGSAPVVPTEPEPGEPAGPAPAEGAQPGCSSCTWGWVALGGAAVAAGVGTYFGLRTLSARDEFDKDRSNADKRDEAVTSRTFSNVAFGVAIVAGVTGVVLLLSGGSDEKQAAGTELHLRTDGLSAVHRF
jgi:hypothetical protein